MVMPINDNSRAACFSGGLSGTSAADSVPLTQVFHLTGIETLLTAMSKSSAIRVLIEALAQEQRIADKHADELIRQLITRESPTRSVCAGALAFFDLETTVVTHPVGAIGIACDGMRFAGEDGRPINFIFVTLSPPDGASTFTNLRQRLTWLLQGRQLRRTASPWHYAQQLYHLLTLDDAGRVDRAQPRNVLNLFTESISETRWCPTKTAGTEVNNSRTAPTPTRDHHGTSPSIGRATESR